MRVTVLILICIFSIPLYGQRKWERLSGKFEKQYDHANYEAALEAAQKILAFSSENLDSTESRYGLSLFYVARAYEGLGDPESARPYIRRAFELQEPRLAYDENMARVTRLFGVIETQLGYHKSASILLSRAIDMSYELYGPESLSYLHSIYAMADLEMAMADWTKMVSLLTDALQIHERNFPLDGDYTMYANYMGLLYMNGEAFAEAILYFSKALMAYGKGGLKEDLGCANVHNNLGLIHYYKTEYENAALHFDQAGEIYRKLTKAYSENYLMLLNNKASLYFSWEKEEELEASVMDLGNYLDLFDGRVDLPYIQGLENMANFRAESGDFDESENYFLRAIAVRRQMDPLDQDGLKRCILSLISVCEEFSMSDKAVYYREMAETEAKF